MEDRRTRARKRLAGIREGIRDYGSPIEREKSSRLNRKSVQCSIKGVKATYRPGELLICNYEFESSEDSPPSAVEVSVIWKTAGKGQEDIGVHFFQRIQGEELQSLDDSTQEITVRLPSTPESYQGKIVKIEWCVRVRLFDQHGTHTSDQPFRLGQSELVVPPENSNA